MQNFIETIRFYFHKILTNDNAFIDNIVCPCGGMVDAVDSKSTVRKDVGVQVSPGVPYGFHDQQSSFFKYGLKIYFSIAIVKRGIHILQKRFLD